MITSKIDNIDSVDEVADVKMTLEEVQHILWYLEGRDGQPRGGARVGQELQEEMREIEKLFEEVEG